MRKHRLLLRGGRVQIFVDGNSTNLTLDAHDPYEVRHFLSNFSLTSEEINQKIIELKESGVTEFMGGN